MNASLILNVALGVALAVAAWWCLRLVLGVLLILVGCLPGPLLGYASRLSASFARVRAGVRSRLR